MAHLITADNVNVALETALWQLSAENVTTQSRNGPVAKFPGPVITTFIRPWERVLFSPLRDANPFFHLFESVWMLAGRKDVASVARYTKQMESFADNGQLHGAYGYRWRNQFGFDQLATIVELLRAEPNTRRAVLSMWSAPDDLPVASAASSKDVPCNTHVYFELEEIDKRMHLNMTVCNRSNDIVWGAYGANSVHMSFLQEFVASAVGAAMGHYHQFSNNFHLYTEREDVKRLLRTEGDKWKPAYTSVDLYALGSARSVMLRSEDEEDAEEWAHGFAEDCTHLMHDHDTSFDGAYNTLWFQQVAAPMMRAHHLYKLGELRALDGLYADGGPLDIDWHIAGCEWVNRRRVRAALKNLTPVQP